MNWSILFDQIPPSYLNNKYNILFLNICYKYFVYHFLSYVPVWGYQIEQLGCSFQDWLLAASRWSGLESRLDEEKLKFLFSGYPVTVEDKTLGGPQFCEALSSFISAQMDSQPRPDIVRLCASELVRDIDSRDPQMFAMFKDALAEGFGAQEILNGQSVEFPTETQIECKIHAFSPRLPSNVELTVAEIAHENIALQTVSILSEHDEVSTKGGKPCFISSSGDLFLAKSTTPIYIVLKSKGKWLDAVYEYACKIMVTEQPFEVSVEVEYGSYTPIVRLQGAKSLEKVSIDEVEQVELPALVSVVPTHQIVFLIDATIVDHEGLKSFLVDTITELKQSYVEYEFGYIIYSKYEDSSASATITHTPEAVSDARRLVNSLPSVDLGKRKFSLAFERGLRDLAQNVNWKSEYCHIILIGSSPPHPTVEEVRGFECRLMETTTDFFQNIDWREELTALKRHLNNQNVSPTFISIWIEPSLPIDEVQRKYANYVWDAFADRKLKGLSHATKQAVLSDIMASHTGEKKYRLSGPLPFPLQTPINKYMD